MVFCGQRVAEAPAAHSPSLTSPRCVSCVSRPQEGLGVQLVGSGVLAHLGVCAGAVCVSWAST